MTSSIEYIGKLRTICTHIDSGNQIITAAPKDNNGDGSAFSPTDMTATSLGACMLSIMAIKSKEMQIDLVNTKAEVTKVMYSEPRRIGELHVKIFFPKIDALEDQKNKDILQRVAMKCPVYFSLHPDIIKKVDFIF